MERNILDMFVEGIPFFEILKDKKRQEILFNLITKGEMTVTEITELSSLSRPAVSYHLKLLNQVNLVNYKKDGVKRIYSASVDSFVFLLKEITESIESSIKNIK